MKSIKTPRARECMATEAPGERRAPQSARYFTTYPEPGRLCSHEMAAFPMAQPSPADAAQVTSCRVGSNGYSPFRRGKEECCKRFH